MEGESREGSAPSETGTALLNIYLICGFSTSIFTDFNDIRITRKNTFQPKTSCVGNVLSILFNFISAISQEPIPLKKRKRRSNQNRKLRRRGWTWSAWWGCRSTERTTWRTGLPATPQLHPAPLAQVAIPDKVFFLRENCFVDFYVLMS